jgi:hypothetical protein
MSATGRGGTAVILSFVRVLRIECSACGIEVEAPRARQRGAGVPLDHSETSSFDHPRVLYRLAPSVPGDGPEVEGAVPDQRRIAGPLTRRSS